MSTVSLSKWRQFLPEIILLNVRWYCRYTLSYRDLEEMMQERGVEVDHSTINRWVLKYAPELDKRIRPYLKPTNDSWRTDETYIKIKGVWKYLYRAVDSEGNTLDFI
jgi:transposase-like protein